MALEQDIAELVTASNNLTQVVDDKMQLIDQRIIKKEEDVNNALVDLQILGDGEKGTTVVNVESLFTSEQGACYLHYKLPFNSNLNTGMFHLHVRGYAYGEAKIVDATLVGYCYKPQNNVINIDTQGSHTPAVYKGSDGSIYGRMYFPNKYFLTVTLDSTRVGNGPVIKTGDIEIIISTEETL